MQKYTKESKELRDKIIAFAKSLGFKVDSSEKQARAYRIWMTGPKDANEKMRDFLAQNKVAHADEEGYDDTGHDEFVSDIETSFQNDPFEGNMLVITHWYATPTKLDRGIDATVSDKDYFGEIRREIRKVLCEDEEKSPAEDKWNALPEKDRIWESKKEKYHSYQDWKDSCKGLYGPFIRFVPSTSADKTEVWRSKRVNPSTGKSIETKKLPSYYDHIEQIGYVIREINKS